VPADLDALCDDLLAETAALDALLVPLDDDGWATATPAEGWTIRDQISHLAYFDGAAVTATTDPDRFRVERARVLDDLDGFTGAVAGRYGTLTGAEIFDWFHRSRKDLVDVFRPLDPSLRVPWYGPDMSAASAVTARIMETWAHGQDVADALGTGRPPSPALRQVAHIGARALPNSFISHGRSVPDAAVFVELVAPSGELWTWGDPDAANSVRGPALDFCLVTTQRRHVADTDITTTGPVAAEWMEVAQAFAGPPGPGRQPGQFPKEAS
jgi:uncharacterized protein (TIGR03084 family)